MTAKKMLPPLGPAADLAAHLRPGADPSNDADCMAIGNMAIAISARDEQVRRALEIAIEEAENGHGSGALRDLFVKLGGSP